MARILITHGRDQAFEIPGKMQRDWSDALRHGLDGVGAPDPDAFDIDFAFYGDIWRPDRRASDDGDRGDGDRGDEPAGDRGDEGEAERSAVAEALEEPPSNLQAGVANELLPSQPDEERLDWDRLSQIVKALDDVFGVGELILTRFLKDLDEYFERPDIREQTLAALREACRERQGPIVLLGHSMGSIVAYDLLASDGAEALGVESLVTFGSPLGMGSLRRRVSQLHPGTPYPEGLRAWANVYNPEDFATAVRELAPLYPSADGPRILDVPSMGKTPSLGDPGRGHDPEIYLSSIGLATEVLRLASDVRAGMTPPPAPRMEDAASPPPTPRMEDAPSPPPPPSPGGGGLFDRVTRSIRNLGSGDRGDDAPTTRSAPPMRSAPPDDGDRGDEPEMTAAEPPMPVPANGGDRGDEPEMTAAEPPATADEPAMTDGRGAGPDSDTDTGGPVEPGTRTVERTASADFPPIVAPGSTHDLIVTVAGVAVHVRSTGITLEAPVDQKTLDLRVGVYAADFDIAAVDDPTRTWTTVTVDLDDPTKAAEGRFKLTAKPTDERRESAIYLTFYRGNLPVGQLTLVTAIDPVHEVRSASIGVPFGGARDPDYVLVVTDKSPAAKGAGPFDVSVSKENEFLNKPLGEFPVSVDAWEYAKRRLDGFRRVKDETDAAERIRAAETLGVELWNDLPEAFQRFYWEELHEHPGASIAIYSQEPYIPWELIKPQRAPGDADGFLGAVFNIARWKQATRFPDPLTVSGFSVIAPVYTADSGNKPLPGAQAEAEELAKAFGATRVDGNRKTVRALLESEDGVQVVHFAGHGDFDPRDTSALTIIRLSDAPLVPGDLTQATLGRASRPFVFLNACEVGEQGWALTRIGGWAEAFTDVGFSGFVGPYWAVNDRVARKAAMLFYQSLAAGLTVAEAVRQIRLRFYSDEEHPAHPSWLAYTLHCQPNIHVRLTELTPPDPVGAGAGGTR